MDGVTEHGYGADCVQRRAACCSACLTNRTERGPAAACAIKLCCRALFTRQESYTTEHSSPSSDVLNSFNSFPPAGTRVHSHVRAWTDVVPEHSLTVRQKPVRPFSSPAHAPTQTHLRSSLALATCDNVLTPCLRSCPLSGKNSRSSSAPNSPSGESRAARACGGRSANFGPRTTGRCGYGYGEGLWICMLHRGVRWALSLARGRRSICI